LGIVPVYGEGSNSPQRAIDVRRLGYSICFLGDSDRQLAPDPVAMEAEGIRVLLWADRISIENRIVRDLPWEGVIAMVALAIEERCEQSVRGVVALRLGANAALILGDLSAWQDSQELRNAIGDAANTTDWFKRIGSGERLGEIVCHYIERIPHGLAQKMPNWRGWIDSTTDAATLAVAPALRGSGRMRRHTDSEAVCDTDLAETGSLTPMLCDALRRRMHSLRKVLLVL
jgi:hypothetical protein